MKELKSKVSLMVINIIAYTLTFVGILLFLIPCAIILFVDIVGTGMK